MIAYLRYPLVVYVGDPPPFGLEHDTIMLNAVDPVVGTIWDGSAFVAPPAGEYKNTATIRAQLADAFQRFATLEATVTNRALTSAETRQAWAELSRFGRNVIRVLNQDYSGATPVTGPDERRA